MKKPPIKKYIYQTNAILALAYYYKLQSKFEGFFFNEKGKNHPPSIHRMLLRNFIQDMQHELGISVTDFEITAFNKKQIPLLIQEVKQGQLNTNILRPTLSISVNLSNHNKWLNELKMKGILKREYYKGIKKLRKVNTHGSSFSLNQTKEALKEIFKLLFEYKRLIEKEDIKGVLENNNRDVILKFIESPFFKNKILFFQSSKPNSYWLSPITSEEEYSILNNLSNDWDFKEDEQHNALFEESKQIYEESPLLFEAIVTGQLVDNKKLNIIFNTCLSHGKHEWILSFIKAAFQLKDVIQIGDKGELSLYEQKIIKGFSNNLKVISKTDKEDYNLALSSSGSMDMLENTKQEETRIKEAQKRAVY